MPHFTKPSVLIVEDEHIIRMSAAEAFLNEGFMVLEAEHAAEAIELHGENSALDLLFTDVNMPGELNGIDLAERLKALTPNLCIIVTSALPLLRPVAHLPALFFAKPYSLGDVCWAAKAALR